MSSSDDDASPMTADEVLTTTRAVRRRLDFDRPVAPDLLRECVRVALQAPAGSNRSSVRFVIVTDPEPRAAIGAIYAECYANYRTSPGYIGTALAGDDPATQERSARSADILGERMGDAPVLVVGCIDGRLPDPAPSAAAMGMAAAALPAMWSFMLAARARHLGTAWTSMHLSRERDVAEILGIPHDRVTQVCLTPVAHTIGTDFRPAARPEPDAVIHWNRW
jgi:nitroreductase